STAFSTPLPPYRPATPSRSSTASCSPVEAPEGTDALVRVPSSRATSTSTAGLPRESRISRAPTCSIIANARTPHPIVASAFPHRVASSRRCHAQARSSCVCCRSTIGTNDLPSCGQLDRVGDLLPERPGVTADIRHREHARAVGLVLRRRYGDMGTGGHTDPLVLGIHVVDIHHRELSDRTGHPLEIGR